MGEGRGFALRNWITVLCGVNAAWSRAVDWRVDVALWDGNGGGDGDGDKDEDVRVLKPGGRSQSFKHKGTVPLRTAKSC